MQPTSAYIDSLRPAGSKRSSKRDLIVNVFLRQEGHLTADNLVDIMTAEQFKAIGDAMAIVRDHLDAEGLSDA